MPKIPIRTLILLLRTRIHERSSWRNIQYFIYINIILLFYFISRVKVKDDTDKDENGMKMTKY